MAAKANNLRLILLHDGAEVIRMNGDTQHHKQEAEAKVSQEDADKEGRKGEVEAGDISPCLKNKTCTNDLDYVS